MTHTHTQVCVCVVEMKSYLDLRLDFIYRDTATIIKLKFRD